MRGAAQGATLGFADEATAALGGAFDATQAALGMRGDISLADAYSTRRDSIRRADAKAEKDHAGLYTAGNIAGGVATAFVPGLGALNAGKGAKLAEVAGKGALQGAIQGAGNAQDWTDIPAEVVRGGTTGAAFSSALHGAVKGGKYIAKNAAPWAANVFGGVKPSNLNAYVENADRINAVGALPETSVQDAVDAGVARVTGDSADLASQASKIEDGLNEAYKAKQAQLIGSATPLEKAKEMTATLQAQKGYLGSLSDQADDALVRSGQVFQKKDLLRSIDKIGGGQGAAIGDEAHAALSKLQVTRDRIVAQLPDQIPAVQMRDVLKQLRKDVNFDMGAGEFNDTLNGMRKDFTKQISGALKKDAAGNPSEYAAYMDRMSDLADNLGTMNRYFGDESKALGSLETLRKGGPRAQLIDDALKNHALVSSDQTLLKHLDEVKKSHALLGRMKSGEDLRSELFPDQWKALQEATANSQMGQGIAEGVERLGPNRTQAVVKNMGGGNANIVDRRALENLSQATGTNHLQDIADKNVFDSFKKGQTAGSRMAVMGSTVGGAIGYKLAGGTGATAGAALGATLGGTLDKYGPAIVKGTADSALAIKKLLANSEAVKRLGPYAGKLREAASKGNYELALVNQALLRTDPAYRSIFKTDNHQQKKETAVERRLKGN
jgi:hypothetical protein